MIEKQRTSFVLVSEQYQKDILSLQGLLNQFAREYYQL